MSITIIAVLMQLAFGTGSQESINWTTFQIQEVLNNTDPSCECDPCNCEWTGWASFSTLQGELKANRTDDDMLSVQSLLNKSEVSTNSVQFGLYRSIPCGMTVGLFGAIGKQTTEFDVYPLTELLESDFPTDLDSFLGGVHIQSSKDAIFRYKATIFAGADRWKSIFDTSLIEISFKSKGWKMGAYFEASRPLYLGCFEIEPMAAAQYLHIDLRSSKSSDPENLDIKINEFYQNSIRIFLGGRIAFCSDFIIPWIEGKWIHESLDNDLLVSSSTFFSNLVDTYGEKRILGRNWALLGAGADWKITNSLSLFGNYRTQIGDHTFLHYGNIGVSYTW